MISAIRYKFELEGKFKSIYLRLDYKDIDINRLGLSGIIRPFEIIEDRIHVEIEVSGDANSTLELLIEVAEIDEYGQINSFKKIDTHPIPLAIYDLSSYHNKFHTLV